ncbi:raffinose synthase or seed imbibition protein Sip1-domain-containing protein [Lipomyces kononenkoae]|uniref:Raffinose synthase or seed imbibition protein Sip1-domain-containing protein n=1 Tax=Lipomyces kononenkoae TaxID=34357 RepID=A0ACC3T1F1_LIPKO
MTFIHSIYLDPPLGSVTCASSRVLEFSAYITTSVSSKLPSSFEFELWWTSNNSKWIASPFTLDGRNVPLCASKQFEDEEVHRFLVKFVPPLNADSIEFTARFRFDNPDWTLCGHSGHVLLYAVKPVSDDPTFCSLFVDVSEDLEATELMSEVVDSKVYKVTGIAAPIKGRTTNMQLGKPLEMRRYLSLVRIQTSWMGPLHGRDIFSVDRPAFMVLFQRKDGYHVCVLPLSNMKTLLTTYMSSDDSGNIWLNVLNDASEHRTFSTFVGVSKDPQKSVQAAFYSLRTTVQSYTGVLTRSLVPEDPAAADSASVTSGPVHTAVRDYNAEPAPVLGTWNEQWMDLFGFCTWNSMGIEVSLEKVMKALQELHDRGIRVGVVILDDGWQVTNEKRQLMQFDANDRFPGGLKHTVSTIKSTFPYIKHVAVWHALLGYWNGIAPEGELGKKYSLTKCRAYNDDIYIVSENDVSRFYDDFYKHLYSSGITAVKADVQMHLYDLQGDGISGTFIHKAYQDALKLHSLRYFYRRVTYCMAMSAEYFYYSHLQTSSPKPALRNSDDFFPNIPSSHHWHIFCNSMNTILTSLLHVIPDWDMFMTNIKPYSMQHAVSRCFSGGPVYITDIAGFHDMEVLSQIQARTIRGTSVALRPSVVATPLDPYLDFGQRRLLFLRNFAGGSGGFSMLAAFNVHEDERCTFLEPVRTSMLPGLVAGGDYVLRSYVTGNTAEFTISELCCNTEEAEDEDILMMTKLGNSEWDVFTAAPLAIVKTQFRTLKIGALGLLNNVTGAAAIERQKLTVPAKGRAVLDVDMKVLGILGIYISDLGSSSGSITKLLITIQGAVVPLSSVSSKGNVLKVDLAKAWTELNLSSNWSNEVSLRLYIT